MRLLPAALICAVLLTSCSPLTARPIDTIESTVTDAVTTAPIEIKPIDTEPIDTEPIVTEPIDTEPIVTEPIDTEPIDTEPIVTEPIVTEPIDTEPARPPKPTREPGEKVVYLTFDDGPHIKNTPAILEILEEYDIPATFFTVGWRIERYPSILADAAEKGHAIACHSYDHSYAETKTADGVEKQISDWEKACESALGALPEDKLFRFPGGSPKAGEARDKVEELGYLGFDWSCVNNDCNIAQCPEDVDELDWMWSSFMDSYKYASSFKSLPMIVLMHDSYAQTVELLERIIEHFISEGYEFAALDERTNGYYYHN